MSNSVGQVQRLDTRHPVNDGMKGKSTPAGNCGDKCCSHRLSYNEHQLHGVPTEQSVGKLTANSGNAKPGDRHANPDLAEDSRPRARVETLHGLPQVGKEKVHSARKLGGKSASPVLTPAALTPWRCKNPAKRGTLNSNTRTDMPSIGEVRRASELGYKCPSGHDHLYTYAMCTRCSRARWVRNQDLKTGKGLLCRSCSHTTTKAFRNHIERVKESGAKRASELGKPVPRSRDPWYYPHLCPICGEQVWHQRKDLNRVCKKCAYKARNTRKGKDHPNWKGGRYLRLDGYYAMQMPEDSLYRSMAFDRRGYVLEHRLLVAQSIGRCLLNSEVVHHINGDKSDNRLANLELLPHLASHLPYISLQKQVRKLEKKIVRQGREIRLLKWHIRELEQANPVLSSEANASDKCVEAIHGTSIEGDEMVQPSGKSDE